MRDGVTTNAMIRGWALGLSLVALTAAGPAQAGNEQPDGARYLWNLATENGPIRTSGAPLAFDAVGHEIVVADEGVVRIFQPNGMEDFSFPSVGMVDRLLAAAVLGESGDLVILGFTGQRFKLVRTSFRGEPLGTIEPRGAPAGFLDTFGPGLMRVHGGRIYLADAPGLRVLVLEQDGAVERAVDLAEVLGVPLAKLGDTHLSGFGVDVDGGLLFTVAVWFKAYALTPAGELREWGRAGGAPGMFNVVAGIAADDGHYYVADQLKCAVIAFDRKDLEHVDEFGYRRIQSLGGLVGPTQLVAGNGRVFVSQDASRGVAAFAAPTPRQKHAVQVSAAAAASEAAPQ